MQTVSEELFKKYHALSSQALVLARKAPILDASAAKEIFVMVENYLSDATYFFSQEDIVRAFAAVNYAHGWLDCGARLGVYEVHDNKYFTED
ncbi:MAG: DUF357 domain-containing protein [Candidatus Woesearchaeota archaeon]